MNRTRLFLTLLVLAILASMLLGGGLPTQAQTDTETPTPTETSTPTETPTVTPTMTPTLASEWVATLPSGTAIGTVKYSLTAGEVLLAMIGLIQMVLLAFIAFLLMVVRRR